MEIIEKQVEKVKEVPGVQRVSTLLNLKLSIL